MKHKKIKYGANISSVTIAGYEPMLLQRYLDTVENTLRIYAKELNLKISGFIEYIPLDKNALDKQSENYKKSDKYRKEYEKLMIDKRKRIIKKLKQQNKIDDKSFETKMKKVRSKLAKEFKIPKCKLSITKRDLKFVDKREIKL